jgi:hypothetical protein
VGNVSAVHRGSSEDEEGQGEIGAREVNYDEASI